MRRHAWRLLGEAAAAARAQGAVPGELTRGSCAGSGLHAWASLPPQQQQLLRGSSGALGRAGALLPSIAPQRAAAALAQRVGFDGRREAPPARGFSAAAVPPPWRDDNGAAPTSPTGGAALDKPQPPSPRAAAARTWVDDLPASTRPYARLMRLEAPAGSWLLFWPGAWSLVLAADPGALPDARLLLLFGAGAVLLRGAGCTINDFWARRRRPRLARDASEPSHAPAQRDSPHHECDRARWAQDRDIDAQVSPRAALVFLGAQLSVGLGILLQLNDFSRVVGAASLGLARTQMRVATYPLMKRLTFWPQAFLGLTFNWGALLGWAAAHGSLQPAVVLPLYASGVAWTLVYDTIYAHQDKADDARVGVYSTALRFGANTPAWLTGFALASSASLAAAGSAAGIAQPVCCGVAALSAAHLLWQVHSTDYDDPASCAATFRSNVGYGGLVFSSLAVAKLLAA